MARRDPKYSEEKVCANLDKLNGEWRRCFAYPRYAVHQTGIVIDLLTFRQLGYHTRLGYLIVSLRCEDRWKTVQLNRLVALTWCDPPKNWAVHQVNYKDGNKANNVCDNLEWSVLKRNTECAYENNRVSEKSRILVMNVMTSEVKEYFSINSFAKASGLQYADILNHYMLYRDDVILDHKYRLLAIDDDGHPNCGEAILAMDHENDKVLVFTNAKTAGIALGIMPRVIQGRASGKNFNILGGYSFMYISDSKKRKFPKYTLEEIITSKKEYHEKERWC